MSKLVGNIISLIVFQDLVNISKQPVSFPYVSSLRQTSFIFFTIIELHCHRHLCQTEPYRRKSVSLRKATLYDDPSAGFLFSIFSHFQSGSPFFIMAPIILMAACLGITSSCRPSVFSYMLSGNHNMRLPGFSCVL